MTISKMYGTAVDLNISFIDFLSKNNRVFLFRVSPFPWFRQIRYKETPIRAEKNFSSVFMD